MVKRQNAPVFPSVPTLEPSTALPNGQLERALARNLARTEWDGVPSNAAIALGLRRLLASLAKSEAANSRERSHLLIAALIGALEGETFDGWKLNLAGRKGPKGGHAERMRSFDIAEFVDDRIETDGFESAVAAAQAHFSCGRTKVTNEYSKLQDSKRQLRTAILELTQSMKSHLTSDK